MNTKSVDRKQKNNHPDDGLPFYARILDEICQERGIKLQWLSNNWVAMLEKDGKRRFAVGYVFGLSSVTAALIAKDKYATYEVLRNSGIPVIEHRLLYSKDNPAPYARNYQSREYIEDYFNQNNRHLVIKPNDGQGGIDVYQVFNVNEIDVATKKIFRHSDLAVMCPFYEIANEYRFIMLDGEVRLVYMKTRGEDWRFNLNNGAKAQKIEDVELYKKLSKLAQEAVEALGLRFCSVDIIKVISGELMVIEVNSGVCVGKYTEQHPEDYGKIKQIYIDVVEKMFAEN